MAKAPSDRAAFRPRGGGVVTVGAVAMFVLTAWTNVAAQENRSSPSNFTNLPSSVPAVYGYVTDPEGKPIEQAKVEIYLNSGFRAEYAVTDNNGFYIIVVPQKSDFWEVRADADNFLPVSTRVSVFRRERVDFTLRPDPRGWDRPQYETRERTKARRTMRNGLELAREGKQEEALDLLRQAADMDPEYAPARNNLAVNLRLNGDLIGAENELRAALNLSPLDYHANFNLGALLYDTGRYHEAAPVLEMAVIADPTSPLAEAMLGRAYLALGLAKRALQHLEEGQRLSGKEMDLTLEISDAYVLAGDLERALRVKAKWLSAHTGDPRADRVTETVQTLETKIAAGKN